MARKGVTFRTAQDEPSPIAVDPGSIPAEQIGSGTPGARQADPAPEPAEDPIAAAIQPAIPANASAFRRRYGVPYDTQGPRVRVGILWVGAVTASLAVRPLRPYGLAVLYAVVAGYAAAQILDAHGHRDTSRDRRVAAIGASTIGVLAAGGARAVGVGLLLLVVAAVFTTLASPERGRAPLGRAGHIVGAAGLCGGAVAALVLLADYEIGAVIILLTFVMVYDASDFVIGSGASNGIEGPLAGAISITVLSAIFAELKAPPFHGIDIWSFTVLAILACPFGQILASALLPRATSRAPALRRLDSLLIVAPAWAGLVGLYLQRGR